MRMWPNTWIYEFVNYFVFIFQRGCSQSHVGTLVHLIFI